MSDLIDRQAAIYACLNGWNKDFKEIMEDIKKLPPVKPEQKIGRWIEREDAFGDTFYNCSACGEMWSTIDGNPWDNGMDYCPNCGAKMQGGDAE